MRKMSASVPVAAPRKFVLASIESRFLERAAGKAAPEVALHVELPAIAGGMTVEKKATAEVRFQRDKGSPHTIEIAWTPQDTLILPRFEGAFTATETGAESCRLELAGTYLPPGGVIGIVVDALAGRRVARTTLETLLATMGTEIESDYRARMMQ
ncbi:MAG: hypothetical protein WCE44_11595 [Candidatus Velthaea sp.]|jgi:hypothetical protein